MLGGISSEPVPSVAKRIEITYEPINDLMPSIVEDGEATMGNECFHLSM